MSTSNEADDICASCGIAEGDDVKLKKCTACKLLHYCSVTCQKEHRPQHKRDCKRRARELREELLFKQPESSHFGDCPICFIPLSLDVNKSTEYSCCSKIVCDGCVYANELRQEEESLKSRCPFCRMPPPLSDRESNQYCMKRIEANDPFAIRTMGAIYYNQQNYSSAFEYWTKATQLGDVEAQNDLAVLYMEGNGVEKDKKKEMYHLEEAAIGGHPVARYNIGMNEGRSGRLERAAKHFIIAAKSGHGESIDNLKACFMMGGVEKEDYAAALRAHQAALDATKSPHRERAEVEYSPGAPKYYPGAPIHD